MCVCGGGNMHNSITRRIMKTSHKEPHHTWDCLVLQELIKSCQRNVSKCWWYAWLFQVIHLAVFQWISDSCDCRGDKHLPRSDYFIRKLKTISSMLQDGSAPLRILGNSTCCRRLSLPVPWQVHIPRQGAPCGTNKGFICSIQRPKKDKLKCKYVQKLEQ